MKTGIRERWHEVRALFEAALEQPRAVRAVFVAAQAADSVLRDAVLALLASEDVATLAGGATGSAGRENPAGADDMQSGAWLGSYRIKRALGRGGMGVVYLAEQAQPRREVAIKLIAGGLDSHALGRFRREADLLARLSHPGIARIIEVAADDAGRPFLVMEYVEGRELSEYARELSREQRLRLFTRIADAVEHAHGRGIVHRDLKPSNILVGADGQPKVLDFGIGLLSGAGNESLTATGMVLGTPAYMSPEQAAGQARIDARADVYALGAIGYELLCNRLPLPMAGLTPLQALRAVEKDTPAPLSRIDATLRGDLETIIGKALAKAPALRYASAGTLADDLRRFLHNEPIQARRPGWMRRALLWGRRNPLASLASILALVSLVGGLSFSVVSAMSEKRARDQAEAALMQARGTLAAVDRVFSAGNPVIAGRPDISFSAALASAPERLTGVEDSVRAEVLYLLANAQANVGDDTAAMARYLEVQQLAAARGMHRLRFRAAVRQVNLMLDNSNPAEVERRIAALLADPQIANDPLALAYLQTQYALVAGLQAHIVTAARRFAEARARFPMTTDASDRLLAAELECWLILLQPMLAGDGGQASPSEPRIDTEAAITRLTALLGAEHPLLARLRVQFAGATLQGALYADWLGRLIADLKGRVQILGGSHPAILAQIHAVLMMDWGRDASMQREFLQLAADAARPLPLQNRMRGRIASIVMYSGLGARMALFSADDLTAMLQAQCPPPASIDADCHRLLGAAARLLVRADRGDEALGLLDAASARLGTPPDPTLFANIALEHARTYRSLGRFEESAERVDRAIEAIDINPEYDQSTRDRMVYIEAVWLYRPAHCERALQATRGRAERLRAGELVSEDAIARLLSICEVRAGHDPAAALRRLDDVWRKLEVREPPLSLVRVELIHAYLEIHDVLGDDAEFARWAGKLGDAMHAGLDLDPWLSQPARYPWVVRAVGLLRAGVPSPSETPAAERVRER